MNSAISYQGQYSTTDHTVEGRAFYKHGKNIREICVICGSKLLADG